MNDLISKIRNRESKIGIIGLGYVGLPLSIRFSEEGFKIIGFDIDEKKVKLLNDGKSYIQHINEDDVFSMAKNNFTATTDFSRIANVDAIIICVPTPLDLHNEPDLRYIHGTLENIKIYLQENQLLVLESTTYPGTTEEEIVSFIEAIHNSKLNFTIGENYFVGYSPEREDPGNKNYTTKIIPKVVSGYTDNCLELTKALYDQIVDQTVPVSSPRVAEMTKIVENIYRAVNIGLANELKMVADKMDIDIYEVINAAATKPFGFTPFYPGPGLGGHCIPIDPFYLSWKAAQCGVDARFIKLAGHINTYMPEWVVKKLTNSLQKEKILFNKAKVLILGIAYKKNVGDYREAPSLKIIELLQAKKIKIDYYDPYVPTLAPTRKYNYKMSSVKLSRDLISKYDMVILVTDHDIFDYDLIKKNSKMIIDTRGRFNNKKNIIRA